MNKNSLLKSILLLHRMNKWGFPVQILTKLIASGQPFVNIIFGSMILDEVIAAYPVDRIMKLVVLMAVSNFILIVLRWGLESVLRVMERSIVERVNQSISCHTLKMDYEILEKKETLEQIQKAEDAVSAGAGLYSFQRILSDMMGNIFSIIYAVGIMVFLFLPKEGETGFLNTWYSGLGLLAVLLFTTLIRFYAMKKLSEVEERGFERNVEYNHVFNYFNSFLSEYQMGKDVRLYRMQDFIINGMRDASKNMSKQMDIQGKKNYELFALQKAGDMALLLASYIYIGGKAIFGLISVGSVMRYVTAFVQLSDNIGKLLEGYVRLRIDSRYVAHYFDYLAIENKNYEGTLPVEKRNDNEYELEFKDVSFHYPNRKEMVLSHVSMKIKVGEKIAIVGPNGAGKSTFIKLLCRLYEPTGGEILLNGIDIRYYDYGEYMNLFSVVFQDYRLFSFSLAENVAASLEYDRKRVEKCLIDAGFGKRLESMENGIDTNLYQMQENGVEISGGESQKIALARALYKDAPIVILDEPTAALDPVSEYEMYQHFDGMVKNKTAMYISHRMSSCRFCDQILVFDKGSIVQKGSHENLLQEKEKLYARLWESQAQYYR